MLRCSYSFWGSQVLFAAFSLPYPGLCFLPCCVILLFISVRAAASFNLPHFVSSFLMSLYKHSVLGVFCFFFPPCVLCWRIYFCFQASQWPLYCLQGLSPVPWLASAVPGHLIGYSTMSDWLPSRWRQVILNLCDFFFVCVCVFHTYKCLWTGFLRHLKLCFSRSSGSIATLPVQSRWRLRSVVLYN